MRSILILAVAVLSLGCEPLYGDLGQVLDPSTVFLGASETYMIGESEETSMITFSEQDEDGVGLIAYSVINRNGETTLLTGEYTAPEEGTMEAVFDIAYQIPFEYDMPATSRVGAMTTTLDEPVLYTGALALSEDEMTIDIEGSPRTFIRIGRLLERIDPSTPDGELLLARLYNYTKLVSLARVPGFGGPGLTMYLNRVGEFQGLQNGRQEVSFRELLSPKSSFTYIDFTDMTGFVLDGNYESRVDISATGHMVGTVDFSMAVDSESAPLHSGSVEYEGLVVNEGVPDEGFYRFNVDGVGTFDVAAVDFHDVDLGRLFEIP